MYLPALKKGDRHFVVTVGLLKHWRDASGTQTSGTQTNGTQAVAVPVFNPALGANRPLCARFHCTQRRASIGPQFRRRPAPATSRGRP